MKDVGYGDQPDAALSGSKRTGRLTPILLGSLLAPAIAYVVDEKNSLDAGAIALAWKVSV